MTINSSPSEILCLKLQIPSKKNTSEKKGQTHKQFPIASRFKIFKCKAAGPTNPYQAFILYETLKKNPAQTLSFSFPTAQLKHATCFASRILQNVYLEPSGSVMAHSWQDKVLSCL